MIEEYTRKLINPSHNKIQKLISYVKTMFDCEGELVELHVYSKDGYPVVEVKGVIGLSQ